MATIGISQAGWDTLAQGQKDVIRDILEFVSLGYPARYVATDTSVYFMFFDHRIQLVDIAGIGCFAANRADWPTDYTVPATKAELRSDVAAWLTNPARTYPFVHPNNVTPSDPDLGVTPEDVLAANQAPAAIVASVDQTWVTYDPEVHGV